MLHNYLKTIIGAALLCSIAMIITPEGKSKQVLGFVCGIAMITALVLPFAEIDFNKYSELLAGYKVSAEKYTDDGIEKSKNLNRSYIEEQCGAYILDKAKNIGADVYSVKVSAEWSNDGYWYPVSAEITHNCSVAEKNTLSSKIESELGIGADKQTWRITDES